ncbi:hypothetical protein SAMN05444354_109195 [Stigmatella aurantiaca]|uniref:Uncharacterized protein n=1 Tax=Stigmatella aurantiaca TaxID=41 RepID=A0A1H7TX89_STIAU|nr:hypothetical protein [Stigmatella aurantiaca]SEL89036.1 hypothetical protein SAMN05444354_109195 [Stigmatella aurantiaca]
MSEDVVGRPPEAPAQGSAILSELESLGSQTAYEEFLAAANALEPHLLEECGADIVLAYHNVVRGLEGVLGRGAVLIGRLPDVNAVELSRMPLLVQGLAFAALQVERERHASQFGALFEQAQRWRRKLRKAAEALAEAELLTAADIDEVRLSGRRGTLEDGLALTALFRRNEEKTAGRSPLTGSDVLEAEGAFGQLRMLLGPQGDGPEGRTAALRRALEVRDRFWTLLIQRHDVLWRCGAWLFGQNVDDTVLPLPSRHAVIPRPRLEVPRRGGPGAVEEPRRNSEPSALAPVRGASPGRDSTRHLRDLQNEIERKARFFVRMGVLPNPR